VYILKTEILKDVRKIYWTVDGEHIFRIQTEPILYKKKGKANDTRDIEHFC
jgi:hypothetical protein